jgi:hypothetical protein
MTDERKPKTPAPRLTITTMWFACAICGARFPKVQEATEHERVCQKLERTLQ